MKNKVVRCLMLMDTTITHGDKLLDKFIKEANDNLYRLVLKAQVI
jgi:hypothetical protein